MAWVDPLDAIADWPGDGVYHVTRFNWAYLAVLVGLLEPLIDERYWEGTAELVASMPGKVNDLIYMLSQEYECPPPGGEMNNIVQVSYILPANTQQGAVMTSYQYNQLKFDTLVGDTTGEASLESPGGVILPAGNWLLDCHYHLFYPNSYFPVKIVHAGDDIVFSDFYLYYATPLAVQHAVTSDGETPISVWLNPGGSYVYFGYSTVYNIARTVGTLTFIEMPA